MKLYILSSAAVAAILSTGINAQGGGGPCMPCPGGITADPDTETIPGRTCSTLQQDAAQFSATSQTCNTITADAEGKCCPITTAPAFSACTVCAGGLTVPSTTEIPNTGGITCDKMMNDAETTAEGGNVCTQMKGFEGICCPQALATTTAAPESTTCLVCTGGIPPENLSIPTIGQKTCEDLLNDAPKFEEGSNACNAMKASEGVCCPFVPTTTTATTTVDATTTTVAEIITQSPTVPTPTVSPTQKPTVGPTSRDQLFGNVLQTPTNEPVENSPTPAPAPKPKNQTYDLTKESVQPTYSPTIDDFNGLAGKGKAPPGANDSGSQYNLPGDAAGAPSAGVSLDFRIGFVVILVSGICGTLIA